MKEKLRFEIKKADFKILSSLEKRMNIVLKMLDFKIKNRVKIIDLEREREVLENVFKNSYIKFRKYFLNIFSNIISCSKILQFENYYETCKPLKKCYIFVNSKNKNLKIVCCYVEDLILKNEIFFKYSIIKTGNIYKAFNIFSKKEYIFLVVKIKYKYSYIINFIKKSNIYIFGVFDFKKQKYLILSKKLYFKKGKNYIYFSFEIDVFKNDFINLTNILTVNSLYVLNLKTIQKGDKSLIYVKVSANFKDKKKLLNLIRILNASFKNFKLYGLYRKWQI